MQFVQSFLLLVVLPPFALSKNLRLCCHPGALQSADNHVFFVSYKKYDLLDRTLIQSL
jgi:hypothetical protein